jgi:hypothetical protein
LLLVGLGLAGAAFAVTGLLVALPPVTGGTCGPGQGSEAPIVALFDPVTIGAGPEPPAKDAAGRTQWSAFVHACQSATDDRAAISFPVLVVSLVIAFLGAVAVGRKSRRHGKGEPEPAMPSLSSGPVSP